ncbi:MAG: glycerophosphodiester phosphodiesterase [Hyphomicrobiaceae bacterium]|nr:glycerophosphodiester phosphodiesterase [Hyphomicrobiaceae bacterium]
MTTDLSAFLRPIAHRGLHGAPGGGAVENTIAAFDAAIAGGYGIECDLRAGRDGLPLVFHDEALDRLVVGTGPVSALDRSSIAAMPFKAAPRERIPTYADLLARVAGRVPLLVEIKSEWQPPDRAFLAAVAATSQNYQGPLALMSFDPAVMAAIRELAPDVARGIVSGNYLSAEDGDHWWQDRLSRTRAERLTHLLESGPAAPHFYAYDVASLPTPVTRYVREVDRLLVFTWTVRSAADRETATRHADAPIFEGFAP